MRRPQSVDDAKAIYREEKNKLVGAAKAFAGSRVLIAVFALFAIAFGTQLLTGRDALPEFGDLSITSVGLPQNLDFGAAGQAAHEAIEGAKRQGAREEAQGLLSDYPALVPVLNGAGFAGSLALLVLAMGIQAEKRKRQAS
jgi:hypothetical protein